MVVPLSWRALPRWAWRGTKRYLLFGYFTPYMRRARSQGAAAVRPEVLPALWESDEPSKWSSRFSLEGKGSGLSVFSSLCKAFWPQLTIAFFLKITVTLLGLASVILMQQFLVWQESPRESNDGRAVGLAAAICILMVELVNILGGNQCNFWVQRVGLRLEGSLILNLFNELLPEHKRSSEIKPSSYNLLLIDIPSVVDFCFSLLDILVLPIRIVLSFKLLSLQVGGKAAAVGLGSLMLIVSVIFILEIRSGFLKAEYLALRDIRLAHCAETLAEIKSVRLIGWERVVFQRIAEAREKEMEYRKKRMFLDNVAASFASAAYAVTEIAVLGTYVMFSSVYYFKASLAIPVIQIAKRLTGPLTSLPFTLNSLIEGYISICRLGALNSQSPTLPSQLGPPTSMIVPVDDDTTSLSSDSAFKSASSRSLLNDPSMAETAATPSHSSEESSELLIVSNPNDVEFKYDQGAFRVKAQRGMLDLGRGDLMIVSGPPASGKTSLLLGLLGELSQSNSSDLLPSYLHQTPDPPQTKLSLSALARLKAKGFELLNTEEKRTRPPIGFCSQTPWLPSGTVQSVILFGRELDVERYTATVKACDLESDFDQWPEGDGFSIAEGGSNISGGQRSRIALARAIYSYSDKSNEGVCLYLFDDPLASVDPQAAAVIMKRLFGNNGLLTNAAVIFTVPEGSGVPVAKSSMRVVLRKIDNGVIKADEEMLSSNVGSHKNPADVTEISNNIGERLIESSYSEEEGVYSGYVASSTYWWYSSYVGYGVIVIMGCTILFMHSVGLGSDIWIAHWTALGETSNGDTAYMNRSAFEVFSFLSLGSIFSVVVLYSFGVFGSLRSSIKIHSKILQTVLTSPFTFYDCFSYGLLLNRFNTDIEILDNGPLLMMSYVFGSITMLLLTIIAMTILSPYCVPLIPLIGYLIYVCVYTLYRPTARELQRSKLLAMTPLCTCLSEVGSGATVIRAFQARPVYQQKAAFLTDRYLKARFMQIGSNNWATTRLQILAFPFTVINSAVPVYLRLMGLSFGADFLSNRVFKGSGTAGFVALGVTFAIGLPGLVENLVWSIALAEQRMCSVQRLEELAAFPTKQKDAVHRDPLDTIDTKVSIHLENVEVSYSRINCFTSERSGLSFVENHLPPSLCGVSAIAKAGAHIGIVGRTGSGKSTLLLALLRLIPITSGRILLGEVDISSLRRSRIKELIGALPQKSFLIKGYSIRQLLDPLSQFTTTQVAKALSAVGLNEVIETLPCGLEEIPLREQHNCCLSNSQIRLLALARLYLNSEKCRLILVDEPPHVVNQDHSLLDGKLIKRLFPNAVIFTVAHHAQSLTACDELWIMAKGRLVSTIPAGKVQSQNDLADLLSQFNE